MRPSTKKSVIRLLILFGLVALGGVAMFSDLPDIEETLEARVLGHTDTPAPEKGVRHAAF